MSNPQKTILIIEDEAPIQNILKAFLEDAGYRVVLAGDGVDGIARFHECRPDLVLLDLLLPKVSGFAVCEILRQESAVPVIMLTALDDDGSQMKGFDVMTDDYITKPFNPLEVVARVKTQLRRYKQYNTGGQAAGEPEEYEIRGLYICELSHKCTLDGKELSLTPFEFSILWYLCKRRGQVVSSEDLFEAVWGEKFLESSNNTVMAHIARLREKMHEPSRKPKYIKTVWGVGYTID